MKAFLEIAEHLLSLLLLVAFMLVLFVVFPLIAEMAR